ncbi:MAG: rhomboid-like protein [Isosphaeraceae bacterium]
MAHTKRTLAARLDLKSVTGWLRTGDVALAYAFIVVAVAVSLSLKSTSTHHRIILDVSTNLANLRHRPLDVLVESAFVVSSLHALITLPALVVVYTVSQRWVGRVATIFVGVLGHVGTTLFISTLLASGISRGRLSHSVARVSDVGVSYGVACVAAFVVTRVPKPWRQWYAAALVVYFAGPLVRDPSFTNVGHSAALVLGFGVAKVAYEASRRSNPSATAELGATTGL